MLKSVVIGAGSRATDMLPAITETGEAVIEAVVEPVKERRNAFLQKIGGGKGFEHLEACFNSGMKFDLAWIFTPPHLHSDVFLLSVSQGLDVFCEKPIDMDLAGADRMRFAARRSGVRAMFGFNRRYMPVGRLARMLCRDHNPVYVHVAKSRPMRYNRMLAENAVHAADTLLRLSGSGFRDVKAFGRFEDPEIEAEQYVAAAVQFVNGQAGTLQMITKGSGVVERFEVYGGDYTLLARMPAEIWYSGDPSRLRQAARDGGLGLEERENGHYFLRADDVTGNREEVQAFLAYLRGETHDVPGVEDAFEAQRLVEEIYRSAGLR